MTDSIDLILEKYASMVAVRPDFRSIAIADRAEARAAMDKALDELGDIFREHFVPDYDDANTLTFVDDANKHDSFWLTFKGVDFIQQPDKLREIPNVLILPVMMKMAISVHKMPFDTGLSNKSFFDGFGMLYAPLICGHMANGKESIPVAKNYIAGLGDVSLIRPPMTADSLRPTPVPVPEEDLSVGDYVNHSDYKLMRLRMLITGTAGPTEEQLSAGLTRLLDHLDKFPLPKA